MHEIDDQLRPSLNVATRETVARSWGAPAARDTAGGIEFWTYYRDYGSKAAAVPLGDATIARAWQRYDKVVMSFERGRLVDYRIEVSR